MFDRLRAQEMANPGSYVSDALYELFQNITIDGAGNRTHSEKRSSKSATEDLIAFHHFVSRDLYPLFTEMEGECFLGSTFAAPLLRVCSVSTTISRGVL